MRFSLTSVVQAVTVLTSVGSVDAFWRMPCRSRTGLARIDPLVDFGKVSQHIHTIHGSNGKLLLNIHFHDFTLLQ